MGNQTAQTPAYSGAKIARIMAAIIFCSVIYGFGMFKLIPMQESIQTFFGISEGAYGYLSTAGNWVIIIFSVQMGFLIRRLPCKYSISLGFAAGILGMLMQIATSNFALFVLGRAVEGAGLAVATLAATSLLMNMVSREKLGFWSGISILCAVAPQIIITKGGSVLMIKSGMSFQTIFVIVTVLYAAAAAICLTLIPSELKINGMASDVKPTREQTMKVFQDKSNWLVNIAYIFFSVVSITFSMYVVRFLTIKGLNPSRAADVYSYTTLLGMGSMLVFGWISDRLKTKRKIVIAGYFAGAVALVLLAKLPAGLIFIYVIVYGTLPRSIAGLTTASSADIAEAPADVPIVNSFRNEITQIGTVFFSLIMGYAIQYLGYEATIYALSVSMVIGGVCWIFARKIP